MKTWKSPIRLAALLGGLLLSAVVLAQVSDRFDLSWHLLSGGGGSRSSTNYQVDDSLGQWAMPASSSAGYHIEPGFWSARGLDICSTPLTGVTIDGPTSGYVDTPYSFTGAIAPPGATGPISYNWSPAPGSGQGTSGATYVWTTPGDYVLTLVAENCGGTVNDTHNISIGEAPGVGDSYEADDTCGTAKTILTNGAAQTHNFHDTADQDWIKFVVQAGKTYIIQTSNVGADHDAVVYLHDTCGASALGSEENAFGQTLYMQWNSTSSGTYYLMLQQYDPGIYGASTQYDISVTVDDTPPAAPKNPRSASSSTPGEGRLIVQWDRSPELDVVGYNVWWSTTSHVYGSVHQLEEGRNTTYYELTGLTKDTIYYMAVSAVDFSGNESPKSLEIANITVDPPDGTVPSVALAQPTGGAEYTTSLTAMTFSGSSQDAGDNLSRVHVRNASNGSEGWDYSLSGGADTFYVAGVVLAPGSNTIQVTAYDDVGNHTNPPATLTVVRASASDGDDGAVIIVAGHNESNGLQSNIYNAANYAYRVFQGAGFSDDDIYYLSPNPQAPYGDGSNKVDATATLANLQFAIETWAVPRVGAGKPLHLYMMDHGLVEGFCADGCAGGGKVPSRDLNTWLNSLETATGADRVNVIIEACHSGSFIDRVDDNLASISKAGRVVIASTGRTNNAYASAQGAYFSDSFFSCVVGSGSLDTCYTQAAAAVALTGQNQTPWLDDNGDGLSNASDGTVADTRYIAAAFGSFPPQIISVDVEVVGVDGTLTASVERGAEDIDMVYAAVYAPSFQEPEDTTLNLGVPVVLLTAVPGEEGQYTASYPNGFVEGGGYKVIFYAQDLDGTHAQPKLAGGTGAKVYLPLVVRE